jgi:general secretion pathway protein K
MALFIVLWILAILMVTVLSFSFLTRTETHATLVFKETAARKFLAEAGIERAIFEIFYRRQNVNNAVTPEGFEPWKADGTAYSDRVDKGSYTVSIIGESGKLDINKSSGVLLKNLLLNSGIKDDEADTIVDSLMDWKDTSGLSRPHGAGSSYYESLPIPYEVKGALFDTVEELLLVKGVTPAILYGDSSRKGIIAFLTVNSESGLVDLNYAPKEVLMSIPGMSADMADAILQYRQGQNIRNPQDVLSGNYQAMQPYITLNEGSVFTIEATGRIGEEKAGYPVLATVKIEGNNKYRYLYFKNPAYKVQ